MASGCNAYKAVLTPLEHYYTAPPSPEKVVTVNFCTDPAVPEKFAVKTIIILDHSGSNKQNYQMAPDGSGAPYIVGGKLNVSPALATDPTGVLRYGDLNSPGSLLNYLSNLPANDPVDPIRYFASVNFSDVATTYPLSSSGFTSDIQGFYQHVLADSRGGNASNTAGVPSDSGATNYMDALQAAYDIITADINNTKSCEAKPSSSAPTAQCPHPGVAVASAYVILFASDGAPIMQITGVDAGGNVTGPIQMTRQTNSQILGEVQTIMALTSNKKYVAGVNLFTVYYYNQQNSIDSTAQSLLSEMARIGNGIAYSAVSGSKIDYTRFQPPARLIKYLLSDLFVTNPSGVWDKNATFVADTDGDGLSDAQELAIGTNPNNADSNNNGVNDLIEYQLGSSLNLSACGNLAKPYKNSDPSGLNDCEKILLNDTGGINNPDSNGDGVPDWLSYKNGVPFQLGTLPSYLSTLSDGYTQYTKIKYSLPVAIPYNQVRGIYPSSYNLVQLSNDASQSCYRLDVKGLPYIGDTDRIRVEIVERSELLQDKYLYRKATKAFVSGNNKLIFNDWNDAAEKSAGTWKVWP